MATQASLDLAQTLYVAYYGRPADQAGLEFWATKIDEQGAEAVVNDFGNSAEFQERFGDLTPEQQVNNLYNQLFARDAEPEGLTFYANLLRSGELSLAEIALTIATGAQNDDVVALENKLAVANAFTQALDETDEILAYQGNDAADAARDYLAKVDASEASVEAALANQQLLIDDLINLAEPEVETLDLTTGIDILEGTAGDDVFSAPLASNEFAPELITSPTLNDLDELDGREGQDRLEATLGFGSLLGGGGEGEVAPTITNIEEFYIRARGDFEFDMSDVSGVEQLWNDRSTDNLTFSEVQEEAVIGLNQVEGGTGYTIGYATGAAPETQTIVTQGAGTADAGVDLRVNGDNLTGAIINALAGYNHINLQGDIDDLTDLTILGSAELDLSDDTHNFRDVENVDASAYTGNLDLNISGVEGSDLVDGRQLDVVTGSGDDRIVVDASIFGDDNGEQVSIDLGEGDNTLALAGAAQDWATNGTPWTADFADATLSGVNTLELGTSNLNSGIDVQLDLEGLDDLTTILHTVAVDLGAVEVVNAPTELTAVYEASATYGSLTLDDVESLTLEASGDGVVVDVTSLAGEALDTLSLVDSSDNVDAGFDVTLSADAGGISSIDLTGLSGAWVDGGYVGSDAIIDASDADYADNVEITLGSASLDYDADDVSGRETFVFAGDNIGVIDLEGFEAGAGANRDRLDFSQFEGIDSTEDLVIVDDGSSNTLISAADGQFDGNITLNGVLPDAALTESLIF